MGIIRNGEMHLHPTEDTFPSLKGSICVVLAELIQTGVVLSVVFASHLFFVNRSERQQVLYKRPIRVYHN
jgi:hypothetical protein